MRSPFPSHAGIAVDAFLDLHETLGPLTVGDRSGGQHALYITIDTTFANFAPTSRLRTSPFPFPCVVWSCWPGSQVVQAVLTDPFTIPDPHCTSVVTSHDTAVLRRGRHQAVPHKHGHSLLRPSFSRHQGRRVMMLPMPQISLPSETLCADYTLSALLGHTRQHHPSAP